MKYKIAAFSLVIIGIVVTFIFPWAISGLLQYPGEPMVSGTLKDATVNGQTLQFSWIGNQLDTINAYITSSSGFEGIMLWLILIGIAILLFKKKEK